MFKGSIVALVTPFTADGKVDKQTLMNLVSWQIEKGTDGIVCNGTTGESFSLSDDERLEVLKACVVAAKGRCAVIAGTGHSSTSKTVEMTKKAKLLGADGCLVVVPYYNRPTQLGCVAHFQEVSKVKLPMIVYNNPIRTGLSLQTETIALLKNIPIVVGIKEASGDMDVVRQIRNKSNIPLFSGCDELTVGIMSLGGVGCISTVANIIPDKWKEIVSLCQKKLFDDAFKLSQKYEEFIKAIFIEPNPQGVKYALNLIGKCNAFVRMPLLEASLSTKDKIKTSLFKFVC
jgi:4-hydroxy-tetrahydrodipicolinate synthase